MARDRDAAQTEFPVTEGAGAHNADPAADAAWRDAALAGALALVDPEGLGGVRLRAQPGPVRDRWLRSFEACALGPVAPIPFDADDGRLVGGLDLNASLAAGAPVTARGLLAEADGGAIVVKMAERQPLRVDAAIAAAIDSGAARAERDGVSMSDPTRFVTVALDEGVAPEEAPADVLLERLAFFISLDLIPIRSAGAWAWTDEEISAAKSVLAEVHLSDALLQAIDAAGRGLGVPGVRPLLFAARAARAHAALAGRTQATDEDAVVGCRLVFGPRATALPAPVPPPEEPQPEEPQPDADQSDPPSSEEPRPPEDGGDAQEGEQEIDPRELEEMIVAAVAAGELANALDLAAGRRAERAGAGGKGASGKAGERRRTSIGGRRIGVRRGDPRRGGRLDLVATMRAAAPWSRLRPKPAGESRIAVRPSDFHVEVRERKKGASIIFLVDASGSSAMQRLNEAKGAVEALLADCYVRRDVVGLITFRGQSADLALAPTQSLARARRALADLPGGGGTPLALAFDLAAETARAERDKGRTPQIVVLSDGRANVDRAGQGGRAQAMADAEDAAARLAAAGVQGIFLDTSRRPSDAARRLADAMDARYTPLPQADPERIRDAVRADAAAA